MHAASSPRPAVWRALGLGAVLLLVAAVAGIALISSGRLDPRLPGPLQAELAPQTVAVGAEEATLRWPGLALPEPPYTVRLQATSSGAEVVAYGLALGGPAHYLSAVISPAGYVRVSAHQAGVQEEVLLWHSALDDVPLPEVEIQIDVHDDGTATVWVEREIVWEGEMAVTGGQVGLLARGEGGAATVMFERVAVFGR